MEIRISEVLLYLEISITTNTGKSHKNVLCKCLHEKNLLLQVSFKLSSQVRFGHLIAHSIITCRGKQGQLM